GGPYLTSAVGYSLIWDSLDSVITPHDGIKATFSQDIAGLGGDVNFLKSTIEARYYRTLLESADIVGMLRGEAGYVFWGSGSNDVNYLDEFFKGGDLVRGFAPNGIGPR